MTRVQTSEENDEALVAAASGGEREALSQLVERHFGTVWAICFARLGDRHAADDLTQEVFLVAMLHLSSLQQPRRFGSWVGQIARNRAVDWLRGRRRSSKLVAMLPPEELDCTAAKDQEPDMDCDERRQAVETAVAALPEDQRELVLLKFGQGLNQAQIAQRLEIHPGTVGRKLDKAVAALRTRLVSGAEESLVKLRPGASVAARAILIAGCVAGLSAPTRAALTAAAGGTPPLAAASGGAVVKGTVLMTATSKVTLIAAAAILAIAGAIGGTWVWLNNGPAENAPPNLLPVATEVTPTALTTEQIIRNVQQECFSEQVAKEVFDGGPSIADPIQPVDLRTMVLGKLPVFTQAISVDSAGTPWLAVAQRTRSDGSGILHLGGTSENGTAGIISNTNQFYPVERTRDRSQMQWVRYEATAAITEPWPLGQAKTFFWIMQDTSSPTRLFADPDGSYPLHLDNMPGPDCIQQLALVLPPAWKLKSSNDSPAAAKMMGQLQLNLWQKHVAAGQGYQVDVKLQRE